MAPQETKTRLPANLCICVINTEGKIVGSWTGDLHDSDKGELELLRQFGGAQAVKFQPFIAEHPYSAQRAYPELFFPWTRTPEEEREEIKQRNSRIASLEDRLHTKEH